VIPNRFVIFWDGRLVALSPTALWGFPEKTDDPSEVYYWRTRKEAADYVSRYMGNESNIIIHEIQFRIVEGE
jgi:hypothetical protein